MIKGLMITPPVLGRISIGKVVDKGGKRLPEKDDQFTITTQVQNKEGWLLHPLDEQLRKNASNGKLRSIPVRMLFNDPDLNLRAEYTLFDRRTGRPLCVGNGESCRRCSPSGLHVLPCPAPDSCELAQGGACKPYGRLNVCIGDDDEVGTFIFRTTGFNSIRTLAARLCYYQAVSGNRLTCLPLELKLRGKSTTQSHRHPIYYVDLEVREGMTLEAAIAAARMIDARRQEGGFDQVALDEAGRQGLRNAAFEENGDELPEILEEFYPATEGTTEASQPNKTRNLSTATTHELREKLAKQKPSNSPSL
jgi:hypothetical protein